MNEKMNNLIKTIKKKNQNIHCYGVIKGNVFIF